MRGGGGWREGGGRGEGVSVAGCVVRGGGGEEGWGEWVV